MPAEMAPKDQVLESSEMVLKDHVSELAEMAPKGSRVGVCGSPWSSVGGMTSTAEVGACAKSVAEARPPGAASAVVPAGANVCWCGMCGAATARTVQAGCDSVQVNGLRWKRKMMNSSCSKKDNEDIIIESQRDSNHKEHRTYP